MTRKIGFKKMYPNAIIPKRATPGSAGMDLYASADVLIQSKSRRCVPTGIKAVFPPNTFGKIEGRSHLAYFYQIDVVGGVIDNDYRGELKVILVNNNPDVGFLIKSGDRVAQLIVHNIDFWPSKEITGNLPLPTVRNSDGFGSTGI